MHPNTAIELYCCRSVLFRPVFSAETSELSRSGNVWLSDNFRAVYVGDSPRNFEDPVVGSRAKTETVKDAVHYFLCAIVHRTKFLKFVGSNERVAGYGSSLEALLLNFSCGNYALTDRGRGFFLDF